MTFYGGYTGRLLRIDLDEHRIVIEQTPSPEKWLGARGWNALIGWREVPPGTGPYDPENRIVFSTGAIIRYRRTNCRPHDGLHHWTAWISPAYVDLVQYGWLLGCRTQVRRLR